MNELDRFKKLTVGGEVAKIDQLNISDDLKKRFKRDLLKEIASGNSPLITAEKLAQFRKEHQEKLKVAEQTKQNIHEAFLVAQAAGYKGTEEMYSKLLFSSIPETHTGDDKEIRNELQARLEEEFSGFPELRNHAVHQFSSIKINKVSNEGNQVEIGGKRFGLFNLKPNSIDIFAGPEGYENITAIKGVAVEREVKLHNKKMFKDPIEANDFICKYIPGRAVDSKIANFALILGLNPIGLRTPKFGWRLKNYIQAFVTLPGSSNRIGHLRIYGENKGIIQWDGMSYAAQVVVYDDLENKETSIEK